LIDGTEKLENTEDIEQIKAVKPQQNDMKVGLDDVGKGMILLAGILLLSYLGLLFVSVLVQVEPGQMIWTLPSYMMGTVMLSVILIALGLIILKLNAKRQKA
jgi:hypothetical protein